MNRITKILMERDGLTRSEAEQHIAECREEINALVADGFYEDAEWVMEHELGLEMDYIFDLI